MKICAKCKIEKDNIYFSPSQLNKKSGYCKSCVAINSKNWSRKNPEKKKNNNKKWKQENVEKIKINNKKWYQNNKEKVAANSKNWAQKNTEKKKKNGKKWRRENPEKVKEYAKKWYQNNTEKSKKYSRKWAQENPERSKEIGKKWYQNNKESHAESNKKWKKNNSEKINAKQRDRWQNDPVYRNRKIVSRMINQMLKSQGSSKNGESFTNYFYWTSEEFWQHLERLFEPWMTRKNQGQYITTGPNAWDDNNPKTWKWQIDHIIPQSDLPFDSLDHPNLKKSWNLSNLRPFSAKQNILDGSRRTRHLKKEIKS